MPRGLLMGLSHGGLAAAMVVIAACGGGGGEPSGGATPAGMSAAPTDKPDGPGVIAGTMQFDGTPPPARPLRMDSDPLCAGSGATSEAILVGTGGGLGNVFVYVKDGLGNRTYAVPSEPALLDQQGCRYVPHVFGVRVGQPLRISNSDPTLHNVHATPSENREFNFGQPAKVPPATRTFDRAEVAVPIRCDVHPWMIAYAAVVPHPFFAVTDEDGHYEIRGLPPGTYTIEAWHEELGAQTQTVTVEAAAPATLDLLFRLET